MRGIKIEKTSTALDVYRTDIILFCCSVNFIIPIWVF